MAISDRIRNARINAGLTMEELAAMCETTKQTIYKYEQGIVTNIPINRIEQLAKHLNVPPKYLMGWEDQSAATPDLTEDEKNILSYFNMLNDYGKEEAVKRVSELSEIDRYKKQPGADSFGQIVG